MSHDPIPDHLEAIGRQLTAAARDLASPAGRASSTGSRPLGRRLVPARPRVLAGASLGLASVGTAAVLAVGALGTSAPPAFAITTHHGKVSLTINRRSGIAAANRRLAAMGIHAQVVALGNALGQSIPIVQQPSNTAAKVYQTGDTSTPTDMTACVINEPGEQPMLTYFPSVAAAKQEIYDPSADPAGNTGGTPQDGPWHVDACYAYTGAPTTGNGNTGSTGNTGNTGAGNTGGS